MLILCGFPFAREIMLLTLVQDSSVEQKSGIISKCKGTKKKLNYKESEKVLRKFYDINYSLYFRTKITRDGVLLRLFPNQKPLSSTKGILHDGTT